jgi:small-conductance mechanosensitive channel
MKGMVMAENQQQQLTPEQTADLVNKTMAENKTFRAMLADTAEKIANLELRNSELKVQNQSLQQVLTSISGQKVETQEEE